MKNDYAAHGKKMAGHRVKTARVASAKDNEGKPAVLLAFGGDDGGGVVVFMEKSEAKRLYKSLGRVLQSMNAESN